jgi:glutathione S-transferase
MGTVTIESMSDDRYRLFSWEHSYFSGKVRSYLRYKAHFDGLGPGFEDILATQDIIQRVLMPHTGDNAVPQICTPDGTWLQDSSGIIDFIEDAHPEPRVTPSAAQTPAQCLAAYLIELLADEWMVVYGFWERWHYSLDGSEPNHEHFNAQQWGPAFAPDGTGAQRLAAARWVFENIFSIKDPKAATIGPLHGLVQLGVTEETAPAWEQSTLHILQMLDTHFDTHDFVLGGLPSLADFGLMAPLYAHLFRDAVPGFTMQTSFPLVAEWVERTNGTNALNARSYNQLRYDVSADGSLVGKPATSHGGAWLPDDEVPDSLLPVLQVFFDEMWPVLKTSMQTLTRYLKSDSHSDAVELPGKTFGAGPGFQELQTGSGPLTHEFELRGVRGRRMVLPYQIWMLQRLADVLHDCAGDANGKGRIDALLNRVNGGMELWELDDRLSGCRVRREHNRIFAAG